MMLERVILYIDIFLLTFAVGLNASRVYVWYASPPPPRHCSG